MNAISTIPPPITGTRPRGTALPSLGLRSPSIRPCGSQAASAHTRPRPAIVPITQSGPQPAPRKAPVTSAPPA